MDRCKAGLHHLLLPQVRLVVTRSFKSLRVLSLAGSTSLSDLDLLGLVSTLPVTLETLDLARCRKLTDASVSPWR